MNKRKITIGDFKRWGQIGGRKSRDNNLKRDPQYYRKLSAKMIEIKRNKNNYK